MPNTIHYGQGNRKRSAAIIANATKELSERLQVIGLSFGVVPSRGEALSLAADVKRCGDLIDILRHVALELAAAK